MISSAKQFIFVHTPKTAGTSMTNILARYCEGIREDGNQMHKGWPTKHWLLDGYYQNFGNVDSYYKFTVVRNPWDRMISYYFWLNEEFDEKKFSNMLKKVRHQGHADACNFSDKSPVDYNFSSCTQYCCDVRKINNFIKFENLEEGWKKACEDIGIPYEQLGWANKAKQKRNYRDFYNDETKSKVERAYADDIDNFEYEF